MIMLVPRSMGRAFTVLVLCAAAAGVLPAQTLTTLHSFDTTDGAYPLVGLAQAINGDLYGVTQNGGANCGSTGGCGTVFKMTPSGDLTTLYSFCSRAACADGRASQGALMQATNGDFYGTTTEGGANCPKMGGCGTVFKITPSGALTTIYNFCSQGGDRCTDGLWPFAGLVQASNGDLYGTTFYGGANGFGTVFKITPSGALTTLYSFCSQSGCADGANPYYTLVQAPNGYIYGTTYDNGGSTSAPKHLGTIFKMNPSGTLTTLYTFCSQSGCTDGDDPSGLVAATDGNLYGTAAIGGANGLGTVFKFTPGGTLTTLYSFCPPGGVNCPGGAGPGGLVQGTDGFFFGTTGSGGVNETNCASPHCGTIFAITPGGTFATLYSFCAQSACADGQFPGQGVVLAQATNGHFYGITEYGGTNGVGAVFSLSMGLGPFVETRPTAGEVGEGVEILGTNLSGATGVSFNGAGAVFTVVSSTEIIATVPAGASSGRVQVVTPSGTLTSNVSFWLP